MQKKKKNTGSFKSENTGEEEGARLNAKLRGECSIANIDRVGGYVNQSGNEWMNRSLEKSVGLRWSRCGRGLLFRNIKTGMV